MNVATNFSAILWWEQVAFQWDDVCFVIYQHAHWNMSPRKTCHSTRTHYPDSEPNTPEWEVENTNFFVLFRQDSNSRSTALRRVS